jgi:hypothetical protein
MNLQGSTVRTGTVVLNTHILSEAVFIPLWSLNLWGRRPLQTLLWGNNPFTGETVGGEEKYTTIFYCTFIKLLLRFNRRER